jgi:hypothetical protein
LYGCETWSPTPKEECRLRVFVNRVLRRIFGPKRKEVAGGWRRLHNEKLHILYASPNIVTMIKDDVMVVQVEWMEDEKCIQNFDWKT